MRHGKLDYTTNQMKLDLPINDQIVDLGSVEEVEREFVGARRLVVAHDVLLQLFCLLPS